MSETVTDSSPPATEGGTVPSESETTDLGEVSIETGAIFNEKGKITFLAFLAIYFAIFFLTFFVLRQCAKFDIVYGMIKYWRGKHHSVSRISTQLIIYLILLFGTPILFAVIWGVAIKSNQLRDTVTSASVSVTVVVSATFMLAFSLWYGTKWYLGRLSKILIGFAFFCAWAFTFVILMTPEYFSFTGMSAIMFATNFLPAVYLIYQKNLNQDFPVFALFKEIAQLISQEKFMEGSVEQAQAREEEMAKTLSRTVNEENKYFKFRMFMALIFYLAPLVAMAIFVFIRQDENREQGIVNLVFLLISDIVIFSLREQTNEITGKDSQAFFIYEPIFQAILMLVIRVILSFNPELWLVMQAIVYFVIQLICAFDLSQTVLMSFEAVRDEQEDVLELYRLLPILQAKTKAQIPELNCFIKEDESHEKSCSCCRKFCGNILRTQIAQTIYFIFFVCLNVMTQKEVLMKSTVDIVFKQKFGQEIFGYFAIFFGILINLYVLWFRIFKYSNFNISCLNIFLYLFFQAVSTGLGIYFHEQIKDLIYEDKDEARPIRLILTAFIILPVTASTFAAIYGIWKSNDYNGYEYSFTQFNNFKPEQIAEYNKLNAWQKIKAGAWKPKTSKDMKFLLLAILNVLSIVTFIIATVLVYTPAYVGITIGALIIVFESTFFYLIRFRESNFSLTPGVTVPAFISVSVMIAWYIYVMFAIVIKKDEPPVFKIGSVGTMVAYILITIFVILFLQYKAVGPNLKKLKKSFYITFIITYILFLAVGIGLLTVPELFIAGVIWIAICFYTLFHIFFYAKKFWIDIFFAFCFVIGGIVSIFYNKSSKSTLVGLTITFLGLFILSFGTFMTEFLRNKAKKRKSIFMQPPQILPMLEFDIAKQEMIPNNKEPILFTLFIFLLILWSLITTGLVITEQRYIPMSIMGLALGLAFIYLIDKSAEAKTIDHRFFKQATFMMYASSLITAYEYKKKWRVLQRNDRSKASLSAEQEMAAVQQSGASQASQEYLKEMAASKQWCQLLENHKKHIGWFSIFESISIPGNNKINSEQNNQVNHQAVDQDNQYTDEKLNVLDIKLKGFVANLETQYGEYLDTWLKVRDQTLEEILLDKQFWTFLNGYLKMKMNLLLQNQNSIIDTTIQMFIKTLEVGDGNKNNEKLSIGNFLVQLKAEKILQIKFNSYLAEQQLKETERIRGGISNDDIQFERERAGTVNKNAGDAYLQLKRIMSNLGSEYGNPERPEEFRLDKFREDVQKIVLQLILERHEDEKNFLFFAKQRDEERMRQRMEEERRREEQAALIAQRIAIKMDEVQTKDLNEDEQLLKVQGDEAHAKFKSQGASVFDDPDFSEGKAQLKNSKGYQYLRIKEIKSSGQTQANEVNTVFSEGVSAGDIRQGAIGDCYLLSAMSVVAHSRPTLLRKIFHPESRQYREDGIYSLMFYQNRRPVVVTVDDRFFSTSSKTHAFVKLFTSDNGEREIWPLLIEKAYAKLHGSYENIVGGSPSTALAHLTNGFPQYISMKSKKMEQEFNTGELWNNLMFWREKNYLMGAGSPDGSDSDVSELGVVFGHAYSILDVTEIDGHRLLQLRNPWGNGTEWKGAWGDNSSEWTERRKRMAYQRMEEQAVEKAEIGASDGVFWISYSDFYRNFSDIYLCRLFDEEWGEFFFESEWSKEKATAGGCVNHESYPHNPQYLLDVKPTGSQTTVEVFMHLQAYFGDQNESIGISLLDLGGKKIQSRHDAAKEVYDSGYLRSNSQKLEEKIKLLSGTPLTLLLSTFDAEKECKFKFTCYFKKDQGIVSAKPFDS